MPDLRDRIQAELDRREAIARKATAGPWARDSCGDLYAIRTAPITAHIGEIDATRDADYVALHDPADALRRYAAARRVLDRHQPEHWGTDEDRTDDGPITCKHCGWDEEAYPGDLGETDYPCHEVIDVADSLGIDTGSTHG